MTALIISTGPSFGSMTAQIVSRLVSLNSSLPRLQEAITTASSGYEGIAGTQFEMPSGNMGGQPNNFGVYPDPDNPGVQGTAFSYAAARLHEEWLKFWTAAAPYIEQLDNGQG